MNLKNSPAFEKFRVNNLENEVIPSLQKLLKQEKVNDENKKPKKNNSKKKKKVKKTALVNKTTSITTKKSPRKTVKKKSKKNSTSKSPPGRKLPLRTIKAYTNMFSKTDPLFGKKYIPNRFERKLKKKQDKQRDIFLRHRISDAEELLRELSPQLFKKQLSKHVSPDLDQDKCNTNMDDDDFLVRIHYPPDSARSVNSRYENPDFEENIQEYSIPISTL